MGFSLAVMQGVCPSPFGRGWRGASGEGENAEMSRHARPHPALRATFSRREKDTSSSFSLVNVLNSYDFFTVKHARDVEECIILALEPVDKLIEP